MDDEESFEPYMDMVDDGCTPILGIRAVMFMTPDGTTETRWITEGRAWVGTALGLLDCVAHEIHHQDEDE